MVDRELKMAQSSLSGNVGADMIRRAALLDRSANYIHRDLESALFPKSSVIFTDRMLSYSRQYLSRLVSSIEVEICTVALECESALPETVLQMANDNYGYTYNYLQKSGLLSTREILDHIFFAAQLAELSARTTGVGSENALIEFIDNEVPAIADAAMALLAAEARENASNFKDSNTLNSIPAEIFHSLVWSVTAAIEHIAGYQGDKIRAASLHVIRSHDESTSSRSCAMRLANLIENKNDETKKFPSPTKDGLNLFFARLACRSGLSHEQLIMFTAEEQMARLVLVMRAIDMSADEVVLVTSIFDSGNGYVTPATYHEIDIVTAKSYLAHWIASSAYQEARNSILSLDREFGS